MAKSETRRSSGEAAQTVGPARVALPSAAPQWIWSLVALVVVGAAVWIVYGKAIDSPLIFDDTMSITNNPSIVRLWPLVGDEETPGPLNPPKDLPTAGRPLVNFSFAINYAISDVQPRSYHVLNIIVHILSSVLLAAIVRSTLMLDYFGSSYEGAAGPLSVAVALLWALHPLQTESVIYVTQRTELFVGFFYLSTLYCSLRYFTVEGTKKTLWLALATFACVLGMACKEVMVSAPIAVLLYDRCFVSGSFKEALRRSWPLYIGIFLAWMLLFALNIGSPRGQSAGFHREEVTPFHWWLTQTKILLMYLKLTVWPWPLVIHYGTPYITSIGESLPFLLPVLALAGITLYFLWRNSPWGFLMAWVWLILSPTLIVPIVTEVAAERRMYLPLAALMSMLVVGGYRLAQMAGNSVADSSPKTRGTAAVVALATLGLLAAASRASMSWTENSQRVAAETRSSEAMFDCIGQPARAIAHFVHARHCWPDVSLRHGRLGAGLLAQNCVDEAVIQFDLALDCQPASARAHYNLGRALSRNGDADEVLAHYRQAATLQPESLPYQRTLATALLGLGKSQQALEAFERLSQLQPDDPQIHVNIASAYIQLHRNTDAIDAAQKALSLAREQKNEHLVDRLNDWLKLVGADPALPSDYRNAQVSTR